MAISAEKNLSYDFQRRKGVSTCFYQYFGPMAFARAKHDSTVAGGNCRPNAPAPGLPVKTRTAAKPATEQQCRCGSNDRQRYQLLPIHVSKITPKFIDATGQLTLVAYLPLASEQQNPFAPLLQTIKISKSQQKAHLTLRLQPGARKFSGA